MSNYAPQSGSPTFRAAAGVAWSVETRGIIVRAPGRPIHRIGYPQAAVWDWMTRGYHHDKIVSLLCPVAGIDPVTARRVIADAIDAWTAASLLICEHSDG